jgi:hypothetical protein
LCGYLRNEEAKMCRIAFIQRPQGVSPELYEGVLKAVFTVLELSNGGHGNGVAIPDRKGKIKIIKGVNYSPCQAAKDSANAPWVLFHTRLATSGGIKDEMCHPFSLGTWGALAHNGIAIGKGSITESDTSAMTRVIAEEMGPNLDDIFEYLDRLDPGVVAIALRGRRPRLWLYVGRGRDFVKSSIGPITIWASEALAKNSEVIGPGLYELPSGIKLRELKWKSYTTMRYTFGGWEWRWPRPKSQWEKRSGKDKEEDLF